MIAGNTGFYAMDRGYRAGEIAISIDHNASR